MRNFTLVRDGDPSAEGVVVAHGTEFPDGIAVVHWPATDRRLPATAVWPSLDGLTSIPTLDGPLRLVWLDDPSPDCREGKHRACTGDAWSLRLDLAQPCPCRCNQPVTPELVTAPADPPSTVHVFRTIGPEADDFPWSVAIDHHEAIAQLTEHAYAIALAGTLGPLLDLPGLRLSDHQIRFD